MKENTPLVIKWRNQNSACYCIVPVELPISKLTATEIKIFLYICAIYDKYNVGVNVNSMTLATELDCSGITIKRSLKRLVTEEFILVSRAGNKKIAIPNYDMEWEWKNLELSFVRLNEEKPEVQKVHYPIEVIEIATYWNNKGGLFPQVIPLRYEDGTYDKTISMDNLTNTFKKLLKGRLFDGIKEYRFYHNKPWTIEEIKLSIDNFHLAATDPGYYPSVKKNYITKKLQFFLYNNFSWNHSPLITYQEKPKPARFKVEEINYPGLTQSLEEAFAKYVRPKPLSALDKEKITVAANRLGDLASIHWKNHLNRMLYSTEWAGYVVEAVLYKVRTSEKIFDPLDTITQGWFWENYFPTFMQKKGIVSDFPIK